MVGTPPVCPNGGGDADDEDDAVYPGVGETCDGTDEDGDGLVDEGCDDDGDGYCGADMEGDVCRLGVGDPDDFHPITVS